jgi:3-phosphoshikimate 1-carboxyvinyltransferase
MEVRRIERARAPLACSLRAVPSKSVTHRALVIAALADGPGAIVDPLEADDTRITREGLRALGVEVRASRGRWTVSGCGGALRGGAELSLGDSGTSLRLLAAVAALGTAPSRLDGSPRLRERPMDGLVEALASLGAGLRCGPSPGGLPLRVERGRLRAGAVRVAGGRSSQFSSALLLIAPRLAGTTDVVVEPPAVSLPYVELTARVLEDFGVRVERPAPAHYRIRGGAGYPGREYRVEGDHSAASYFLAAAAAVGGRVCVQGLDPRSAQPDARLGPLLEAAGCRVEAADDRIAVERRGELRPFDVDLAGAPDLVPTLAVLALVAGGPSVLRGVAHLRLKESDRIAAIAENVRLLGRDVAVSGDALRIVGSAAPLRAATIRTRSDHRVAMAFAVAGLRDGGVAVDDAGCVSKSNPHFWRQLEELRRP